MADVDGIAVDNSDHHGVTPTGGGVSVADNRRARGNQQTATQSEHEDSSAPNQDHVIIICPGPGVIPHLNPAILRVSTHRVKAGILENVFDGVFDDWSGEICGYRTLHVVDRPVRIDTTKAFPALGTAPRRDELPMWVKAGGYSITGPWMPGRQIAWIRRANDGAWIAVCLLPVRSGNGHAHTTMQLWLEADTIAPLE